MNIQLTHTSQVAVERTRPHGRVVGIDLIPAQPPRGVSTFQGDFLSPSVQSMVKTFITETHKQKPPAPLEEDLDDDDDAEAIDKPSYFDLERHASEVPEGVSEGRKAVGDGRKGGDAAKGRLVDVSI